MHDMDNFERKFMTLPLLMMTDLERVNPKNQSVTSAILKICYGIATFLIVLE